MSKRKGRASDYAAIYKSIMFWRAEYIKRQFAWTHPAQRADAQMRLQTVLEYLHAAIPDERLMPIMAPFMRLDIVDGNTWSMATLLEHEDGHEVRYMNDRGPCSVDGAAYVLFREKLGEGEILGRRDVVDADLIRKMQLDSYLASLGQEAGRLEPQTVFDRFVDANRLLPSDDVPEAVAAAIRELNACSAKYGYYAPDLVSLKDMAEVVDELLGLHNNQLDISSKDLRSQTVYGVLAVNKTTHLFDHHDPISAPPRPFPFIHHQVYCKNAMTTFHVNDVDLSEAIGSVQGNVRADTVFAVDSRDEESLEKMLKEIERILKIKNFLHTAGLSAKVVSSSPLDAIHLSMPEDLMKVFVESLERELDMTAYRLEGDMGRALGLWMLDHVSGASEIKKTSPEAMQKGRDAIRKSKLWGKYVTYRDGLKGGGARKANKKSDDDLESENVSLGRFYKSALLCVEKGGIVPRTGRT